ncbi:MAG: metal ABC transporter permease [Chloroflexi bacterium]|nr:metal ABC transporter permease [Chloroflexota bacterium]
MPTPMDIFFDYTIRTVALGAAVLGMVSGALGTFAVLRRQSLLGDAMSHAALPGVVLAFMLTHSKAPLVLMLGAAVAGGLGTLLLMAITRTTRIKEDSALGIILSAFFGLGLMLLTVLQRNPIANQAGLNKFLFGQAATLLVEDVVTMTAVGLLALLLVALFWKEFKLLSFDRDYGASVGYPMLWLDVLLTFLLVLAIVIGLQAVGVVLMSAMVVAPASAARQWTDKLGVMVVLAGLFGAVAGISGTVISGWGGGLATGPVIVLVISLFVAVSFLFAGNRGLVWRWAQRQRNRTNLRLEAVLSDMFKLAHQHEDWTHPHAIGALRAMNAQRGGVENSLRALAQKGWVRQVDGENWALTPAGIAEAQVFGNGH